MLYSDTNQKVIDSSKQNKGIQKKDECGQVFKDMTECMHTLKHICNTLVIRFIDWQTKKEESIELSKFIENYFN